MNNILLFNVAPSVPPELAFLEKLAYNLWWSWNSDAIELFRRINPELWNEAGHNPLEFLGRIPQKKLEQLAEDDSYLSHLEEVAARFDAEVTHGRSRGLPGDSCIAYLSLEYGIHESIRLYSGGLGCLAGDHLKSASDLRLPLVGVGLLYRQGFFQQYLNSDGWQQETYSDNELNRLPIRRAVDAQNRPVSVSIPLPDGMLHALVWRLDVGRVPLYLLDANIPDNLPAFRDITRQLYVTDRRLRLRQELLLGIGGFKALTALGLDPSVCHMNEGHAAFVSLARLSHLIKARGYDLSSALEIMPRTNVFTTHTPVPAGNEYFPEGEVRAHMTALESDLGIKAADILSWGKAPNGEPKDQICMTILGLRMAEHSTGVSHLHGEVERRMWSHLWPERPVDEVPICAVTNGVHVPSWLSSDVAVLYDRYLGPDWRDHPGDPGVLARIGQIPDEELWRAHELGRSRLVRRARETGERQMRRRNAPPGEIAPIRSVLNYHALTIGFARRFATYKRAALILRDRDRLEALLTNKDRPVQLIFSGKAHPADDQGKDLIRQIIQFAHKANVRHNVMFLEDYDIRTARYLVQGVDVWLNTPRRPEEASGTSGMKAAINGVLNLSVLDGWWCEGYCEDCGWAIGGGEEYTDHEYQDTVESRALYNLLETEVIPCYYDERADGDLPRRWLKMMKASIRMAFANFSSHRMVQEYYDRFYVRAAGEYGRLTAENSRAAHALVEQRRRFLGLWSKIVVESPRADRDLSFLHVGDRFKVSARVFLGEMRPEEVDVQVYHGPVNPLNQVTGSHAESMALVESSGNGWHVFSHEIVCQASGRYGFTSRVVPRGADWRASMPGFMTWANGV